MQALQLDLDSVNASLRDASALFDVTDGPLPNALVGQLHVTEHRFELAREVGELGSVELERQDRIVVIHAAGFASMKSTMARENSSAASS